MRNIDRKTAIKIIFGKARELALNWEDEDNRRSMLAEWGFPASLRDCHNGQLKQVLDTLGVNDVFVGAGKAEKRPEDLVFGLMKRAGWDRQQLKMLMVEKFNKEIVADLDEKERRQLAAILKKYADKR